MIFAKKWMFWGKVCSKKVKCGVLSRCVRAPESLTCLFFYYFRMRGSGSERVYWLCLELWSAGWHVGGAADSYQDFTTKIIILKRSGLFLFFSVQMIQNVKAVIYVFKIYFLVFVPLAGRGKHLPPAPNFFFSFLFSFLFWSFLVCLFSKTQQNVSSRCRIWISRMISHTSCLATEFNDIEKWASFFFVSISKSGSRGSLYVRAHPLQTLYVFSFFCGFHLREWCEHVSCFSNVIMRTWLFCWFNWIWVKMLLFKAYKAPPALALM